MEYPIFYLILCMCVGWYAQSKKLSYTMMVLTSLILTPFLGLLISYILSLKKS